MPRLPRSPRGELRRPACRGCGRDVSRGERRFSRAAPGRSVRRNDEVPRRELSRRRPGRDRLAAAAVGRRAQHDAAEVSRHAGRTTSCSILAAAAGGSACGASTLARTSSGIDTGTFFAREARSGVDLVVGELRRLPFAEASVTKAYTIDVLEHLSPEGLHVTLAEMARVLAPGGALFVYTHVRQRSLLAPVLRLIAANRLGDRTARLRGSDHRKAPQDGSSEPADEPRASGRGGGRSRVQRGAIPVLHAALVVDRRKHPGAGRRACDGQDGCAPRRQDRRLSIGGAMRTARLAAKERIAQQRAWRIARFRR